MSEPRRKECIRTVESDIVRRTGTNDEGSGRRPSTPLDPAEHEFAGPSRAISWIGFPASGIEKISSARRGILVGEASATMNDWVGVHWTVATIAETYTWVTFCVLNISYSTFI